MDCSKLSFQTNNETWAPNTTASIEYFMDSLENTIRYEKEIKGLMMRKEEIKLALPADGMMGL